MPGPKVVIVGSSELTPPKPEMNKISLSEKMLGLFGALGRKYNYHPERDASPQNIVALQSMWQDMSSPMTYRVKEHHGLLGRIYDELIHPSGRTNPFFEVDSGQAMYHIADQDWNRIMSDIALIIGNTINRPETRTQLFGELRKLVTTASTHQDPNDQDQNTSHMIVKQILSHDEESPTLSMFWINFDLGSVLYGRQRFPMTAFQYFYLVWGFNEERYDLIFPDDQAEPMKIEEWLRVFTTPDGPYSARSC